MSTEVLNTAQTERPRREDWLRVEREPTSSWGYRCHLLISKDDAGTFSAVVLNLPGIGSCGDTEEDAIANAKDAIRLALEIYEESREEVPWKDTYDIVIPPTAKHLRIILDA